MKKMSFLLAIVLLLSFCFGGCGQPQPNPKLDDLNLLCETLETGHYDLYANISEEEFQTERKKIARQTLNMTDAEFYWSVRHLLSLVGDAHTTVYPSDYFMSVLPWNIKKFDEGWFILILDKAHEQYLGTRVVAINDLPIDEVVERTRQVISYEADTWLWQKVPDVLGWKEALEYLDIVEPDEPVLVTVETAQGAEETFELPAYDDWSDEKKQEVLVGFQRDSVPVTAEQDAIYWPTALDESTYFIQYNSCKEDPDLPMAQFAQQVEADLESGGYQNIIIDLRYNSGGNSEVIRLLEKPLFFHSFNVDNVQFYILIGGRTFSSATIAATDFKNTPTVNSIFVGQPTGGVLKCAGDVLPLFMENTPIAMQYSTKYFDLLYGVEGPLEPDYTVPQPFAQYAKGEDAEIAYLYENLL